MRVPSASAVVLVVQLDTVQNLLTFMLSEDCSIVSTNPDEWNDVAERLKEAAAVAAEIMESVR